MCLQSHDRGRMTGDGYVAATVKRLGEDKFFSGAFDVFRYISDFFLSKLFGGKEIFRIFANGMSVNTISYLFCYM